MDTGKYLGVFRSAFGLYEGFAAFDRLSRLFQDADHVEIAAATQAEQQHLHGPYTEVSPTVLGWPVHDNDMTASGFAQKHSAVNPLNARFHRQLHKDQNK